MNYVIVKVNKKYGSESTPRTGMGTYPNIEEVTLVVDMLNSITNSKPSSNVLRGFPDKPKRDEAVERQRKIDNDRLKKSLRLGKKK